MQEIIFLQHYHGGQEFHKCAGLLKLVRIGLESVGDQAIRMATVVLLGNVFEDI